MIRTLSALGFVVCCPTTITLKFSDIDVSSFSLDSSSSSCNAFILTSLTLSLCLHVRSCAILTFLILSSLALLYRKFVRPDGSLQYWQMVVPRSLRTAFLDAVHSGLMNSHPGIERTRLRLQEIAYWRGWTSDVQMYVQHCHVCASLDPAHIESRARCSVC